MPSSKLRALDRLDLSILSVLQRDGRISYVDLAEKVGLSSTPCIERVKRLEKEGYIESRKREVFSTIISCMTWLFVAALFFVVHWRLHKKYSLSS